jgi:hypothetical protein
MRVAGNRDGACRGLVSGFGGGGGGFISEI